MYQPRLNMACPSNAYIIHKLTGKVPRYSDACAALWDHLNKVKGLKISLTKACDVHQALIRAKTNVSFSTFTVSEVDSLIAELGTLLFKDQESIH